MSTVHTNTMVDEGELDKDGGACLQQRCPHTYGSTSACVCPVELKTKQTTKSLRDCWEYEEPIPDIKLENLSSESDKKCNIKDEITVVTDTTICDCCLTEFQDKFTLKLHIQAVHSVSLTNPTSQNVRFSALKDATDCRKKPKYSSKTLTKTAIRYFNKTKRTISFQCDYCDNTFVRCSEWRWHLLVKHAVKKPYLCHFCDYKVQYKSTLTKHMESHSYEIPPFHKNEIIFKCNLCHFTADRSQTLEIHMKSHTLLGAPSPQIARTYPSNYSYSYQTYICDSCNRKFSTRKGMHLHVLVCYSTTRFKCNICNLTCISEAHLKRHSSLHSMCRRYVCKTCGYRFLSSRPLKEHIKLHEPIKLTCEFCNLECLSKRHLAKHRRRHTHSVEHKCVYCDYTAKRSDHLQKHVRRHTGEKYKCEFCDFTCVEYYLIGKHMKKKHDNM